MSEINQGEVAMASANLFTVIKDIFPNYSDNNLNNIIALVEENNSCDSFEQKVENVCNLLYTEYNSNNAQNQDASFTEENDGSLLYNQLINVFPDISPKFLLNYCQKNHQTNVSEAIDDLCSTGYDKLEMDPITIWQSLKSALPNADPSYLKTESYKLVKESSQDIDDFLQNAIEKGDYPTMDQYLRKKKEQEKVNEYKTAFDVDRFLTFCPNPVAFYSDSSRVLSLNADSNEDDKKFALAFLLNEFRFVRKKNIEQVFKWTKMNLVKAYDWLDDLKANLRKPRDRCDVPDSDNVSLMRETLYLKNKRLIILTLKRKDDRYRLAREEAEKYGLLETCKTCFLDGLIPEEVYCCKRGCFFCKECLIKGTEVAIGQMQIHFPCMAGCGSEFSMLTLQMVLPKRIFERLSQRIASEEIKKANLDGMFACPFCEFAAVLPERAKIFKCLNDQCGKESCCECRHESHVPLRCDEVEFDEDVQRRTLIENKMAEALIRTCYSCRNPFVKTSGCNKMTCNCGAVMCYLCGAENVQYSHFSSGCALFSNDAQVNLGRVKTAAENAKKELGQVQIKNDPSVGIESHFN